MKLFVSCIHLLKPHFSFLNRPLKSTPWFPAFISRSFFLLWSHSPLKVGKTRWWHPPPTAGTPLLSRRDPREWRRVEPQEEKSTTSHASLSSIFISSAQEPDISPWVAVLQDPHIRLVIISPTLVIISAGHQLGPTHKKHYFFLSRHSIGHHLETSKYFSNIFVQFQTLITHINYITVRKIWLKTKITTKNMWSHVSYLY